VLTTLPLKETASFKPFFDAVTGCVPFISDFSSVGPYGFALLSPSICRGIWAVFGSLLRRILRMRFLTALPWLAIRSGYLSTFITFLTKNLIDTAKPKRWRRLDGDSSNETWKEDISNPYVNVHIISFQKLT
jgi:hypothetical protein